MSEFIYIGIRKADGSIRATCCDDGGCENETALMVGDWIRRGLVVERVSDAEYRARLSGLQAGLAKRLDAIQQISPPPLPSSEAFGRISNHDFARADQTPKEVLKSPLGGFTAVMSDGSVHELDDDMKTRIVRTPVDAA